MSVGDRAVRAFRKYAMLCPDSGNLSYFDFCERLRKASADDSLALSMLAVHDTLHFLSVSGKSESADAVRYVYFAARGRVPRKNEISDRVRRFARMYYLDERTVWRRLSEAKSLYMKLIERKTI